MNKSLYKDLFTLPGISGYENKVKEYIKTFFKKLSNYEIIEDNLGSIFAYKKSKNKNAPFVVVAGHMDEVGFIVSNILDNGALKLQPVGGINTEVVVSQVLELHTDKKIIPGIVGALPPHIGGSQNKQITDLIFDIGAKSYDEAIKNGVEIGQMITFKNTYTETFNKKRIITKALDNRIGCGVSMELAKLFNDKDLDFDVAFGATVQEEVGLRGAKTSSNLLKPDIFIAVDSSPIDDLHSPQNLGKMDEGAMIRVYDPGSIMPAKLRKYLTNLATKKKINWQYYISRGRTDASEVLVANNGVLAFSIVLPARYIHSNAGMFSVNDLESVKDLVEAVLNDLNTKKINELIK